MNPKHQALLSKAVDNLTRLYELDPARGASIFGKVADEAHRAMTRAKHAGEVEGYRVAQTRGPTLVFDGRELYSDSYEGRAGTFHLDLYATLSGKFVIVWETDTGEGEPLVRAKAFEPDAIGEMMDWLEWGEMARDMAKKLGWVTSIAV